MTKIEPCISNLWQLNKKLVDTQGLKYKNFVKELYEHTAGLLIVNKYSETTIENIFGSKIYATLDYDTYIKESEFKNIQDIINYLYDNTVNKEDYELLQNNEDWNTSLYEVSKYFEKILEETPEEDFTERITELLEKIDKSTKIQSTDKKQLITCLEKELGLFTVDVEDSKLKDGYRRKYYKIDSKSNTYLEINRGWLQTYFNEYPIKLHETPNFYEDVLSRTNNLKTMNNHYLEFENVYIDKRTYNIINKNELTDVFTEDRLYYEDYTDNALRLFKYDENINLYDVLRIDNKAPNIEPTLAMDTFIKIFVPRNEPENISLLLYILQTIGMMVLGRNPAKRITILYDETEEAKGKKEGDSGKSTARKIIQEIFKKGNGDLNDKILNDNFMINSIEQANHFLFMDELKGNELKEHIHTLKRLSSGYEYNGRKTYDNKQTSVSVPPIIISMNGVPELPLYDKAYLKRYVLCKMPNVFKPAKKVDPDKDEYPEVSNIVDQIQKDADGLHQLISIAINEYITLNQHESIREQLALNPTIEETIAITSKSDIVLGILKAYTKAYARTTNKSTWVSNTELQDKIKQVYKKSNDKEINPQLIDSKQIGYKLIELYPSLFTGEAKKLNRKRYNGGTVYNITLLTEDEINKKESEIIEAYPESEHNKIFDTVQMEIHKKIMLGVNTEEKLFKEFEEVYTKSDIMDGLEELYKSNLIDYTDNLNFID